MDEAPPLFGNEREKGGGEGGAAGSQSQSPGPGANNNSRVANSKAANPNASKANAVNTNAANSKVANSKAVESPAAASPAANLNGPSPEFLKKRPEWYQKLIPVEKQKEDEEEDKKYKTPPILPPVKTMPVMLPVQVKDPGTPKSATGTSTTPSKAADPTSQAQPETTTANPIAQQDASSMVTEVGDGKAKGGSKLNPKNWLWWYWLIIGIVVLAVVAVVVVVCLFAFKSTDSTSAPMDQSTPRNIPSRPTPSRPTCTTSACTAYSTALTDSINKATQPCDDFHEYACAKHDYTKDKVSFIGSAEVEALMTDAQATSTGLPQVAKMLYDACKSGTLVGRKIETAKNLVYMSTSFSPEHYVMKLAEEGYTNFGHFKLDLERLMDPNEINPKPVIVIQKLDGFETTVKFGYEDIEGSEILTRFDSFDSSENTLIPSNNTLIPLADITGINEVKKNLLTNVLTGWFPAATSQDVMFANVWTYKYEYWTNALDASVKPEDNKRGRILFHHAIAKRELEKSFKTTVFDNKNCHALVAKTVPQAFAKFDNGNVDKKKEEKIKGMAEEYKTKQAEMLKNFNVDDTTRTTLIAKVATVKTVVGFPEEYAKNLAASSLKIDASTMRDIYEAYPQMKKFQLRQHFAHLAKPQEYPPAFFNFLPPSTIHNIDTTTLYIHPRLLDDPSLDEDYPSYVVNGAVGVVIGKAIADIIIPHASTSANYKQSAQCYGEEGKDRPYGKATRDELVGDHLGVISSYKMAKKDESAPLLPGFKSNNNDDVFFLAMAQRMCATPFDGFTIRNDADEFKKVGKKRVNTMVSNMPEFATTFNCQVDAQMHKAPKCTMY